jgi:cytochrome c-type biogenesis protein CcsB
MNGVTRRGIHVADAAIVLGLAVLIIRPLWSDRSTSVVSEFAQAVDLQPLASVAVQANGRLKSFDSYARSIVALVSGPRHAGTSPSFIYLDMLLRGEAYRDADIVYVKHKLVRRRIAERLASDPQLSSQRLERFRETGRIAPALLQRPEVASLLAEMDRDVIRTSKAVSAIRNALGWSSPRALGHSLMVVPPPSGTAQDAWYPGEDAWSDGAVPQDSIHAGMGGGARVPGLDPGLQAELSSTWRELGVAWRDQKPHEASAAIAKFADQLARVNPALYPAPDKLRLESWYFRYKGMVWTWLVYLLAVIPLLMATVYHWRWARGLGFGLLLLAFGLHTASLGIRWYLAGRIPNSNMYEAIMAATWFGALIALVLEFIVRRTPMRNLFAIGAAVCAMAAMMCGHFLPAQLNSDIGNIMPVLHDVWLYIHTNVIIASYCLIGMAAVTALLYLRYRFGGGPRDHAKAGAGALIMGSSRNPFVKAPASSMGQVLDGATMVLMELSFVMLWAGLVMGAIWADHSWGRPWGWDPKEVFALNTFIVFLVLVHIRLKVRDKGLWTAILACVGCAVMLFNWIVVNFVISGLHSYA